MKDRQTQEIKVELNSEASEGNYANLAIISHSDSEFILDFAKFLPGTPSAKVHSRIIMTPKHTKLLLKSLQQNVGNFEAQFGEIPINEGEAFLNGANGGEMIN